MPSQNIFVIGYDEIVLMLGLLGIEGIILKESGDFLKHFKKVIKNPNIGIVLVALDLPDDLIKYLIDFKLHSRRPFVFYLPDIFQPDIEHEDIFYTKIQQLIQELI